jgi:serine-type D-Ala-D-Ala carboxypeptidase/endopeptidase (penicillin-binding protein 4)
MSTGGIMTVLLVICLLGFQLESLQAPTGWRAGVFARCTETSEILLNINGNQVFRPASTVKALTALAALEVLGPEYIYSTTISADTLSNTIVLRGAGAPLLSAEAVVRAAMETAGALPPGRSWRLLLDTNAMAGSTHLPGWDRSDWDRTYCPPVETLSIGDNVLEIVVSSVGGYIRVFTYPRLPSLVLHSQGLRTGSVTDIEATGGNWVSGTPEITLSGSIAAESREIIYKPFAGAPVELALELQRALSDHGIDAVYTGTYTPGSADTVLFTTAVMYSEPMWVLLGSMNKWSRNMVAEQILRTIALEASGEPGSTRAGCDVSGEILEALVPEATGWQLADGSGLSRHNMLTPEQLTAVFTAGESSLAYGPEFLASFPVNGVDGTLSRRMTGIPPGAFRGKTGSLGDTCTIAGILTTESGREIAIAVFLEIPRGQLWRARAWQDRLLEDLYDVL